MHRVKIFPNFFNNESVAQADVLESTSEIININGLQMSESLIPLEDAYGNPLWGILNSNNANSYAYNTT